MQFYSLIGYHSDPTAGLCRTLLSRLSVCLLVTLFSIAGLSAQNALEREVAEAKSTDTEFTAIDLFERNKSSTLDRAIRDREPALRDFSLLQLDKQAAVSVLNDRPLALEIPLPNPNGGSELVLDLVRFDLLAADFEIVEMPANTVITDLPESVFYRGSVRGNEGSLAILSVIDGEISGLLSLPGGGGDINLVYLEDEGAYLLYDDAQVRDQFTETSCDVLLPKGYSPVDEATDPALGSEKVSGCFGIYFDIGKQIRDERGGTSQAVNFIQGAFAQVAVLYANEEIDMTISGTRVWTSTEPFFNNLDQYRAYRAGNNVNGSVAHYVHRAGGGGVAYLNTLCNKSYGYGMSGIDNSFNTVPNYSWTVYVLTHELGHNFGSDHTHECAWNGNNTPIDGCGSPYNGCGTSSFIPSNGGTIMSYCHLTSTGINFSKGFGDQPGNRIRSAANQAGCKGYDCGDGGGGNGQLVANGVYNIIGRQSNKAMRVRDGGTARGTSVVQYTLNPNWGSQRWAFTHLGNDVYKIINPRSNRSLDVSGISRNNGADVHIWDYLNANNQKWKLQSMGGGFYQFRAQHSNKCLNVSGFSTSNNGNIQQYDCSGPALNDDFRLIPTSGNAPGALATSGTPQKEIQAELDIYPNPASSTIYLDLLLGQAYPSGSLTLSTIQGRVIHRLEFAATAGMNELSVDVSQRTPGAYIVRIQTGDEVISRRVMVTR